MPAGRKTKLNPERQARICEALRGGNTRRCAATLGGIGVSTFYDWLDWASPEHENHDTIYSDFSDAVARAEAEAEEFMVSIVKRDAEFHPKGNGYQAALQWLNRRKPKDWSERLQVQQTNLNIDFSSLTDEQLDRLEAGEDPASVIKSGVQGNEGEAEA